MLKHLQASQDDSTPLVVCGDFNADPDSDETRMVTGRTAAPRRGGAGHPLAAELLGTGPVEGMFPSDHFAVQADLRY